MSMEFIAAISPGLQHVYRQRELEQNLYVDTGNGLPGDTPLLDLDSGFVTIAVPEKVPGDSGVAQ